MEERKKNHMEFFQDFLMWYNNKDVVPTREVLQKMTQFYHQKGIDMLKVGFSWPNLANRILHLSTSVKSFPFNQEDKSFDDFIPKLLTGSPSIFSQDMQKLEVREASTVSIYVGL